MFARLARQRARRVVGAKLAEREAELRPRFGDKLRNMLDALNETMETIAEVGEDRERAFNGLRNALHDVRLDLAHLRGDHAELKLALANGREKAALDLANPLRRPQIN